MAGQVCRETRYQTTIRKLGMAVRCMRLASTMSRFSVSNTKISVASRDGGLFRQPMSARFCRWSTYAADHEQATKRASVKRIRGE